MVISSQPKDSLTKASSLVKLGIGDGGSLNNGIDQGSYKGTGLPGQKTARAINHPGSLDFLAPLEESKLVVGQGGQRGNLDPLRAAWGDFIDRIGSDLKGWDWFATFTFRDPENPKYPSWTKPGWIYAHKALKAWADTMMSKRLDCCQPYWLACMEYQPWRGVPHWHLLVGNTDHGGATEERRMDWVDWWYEYYGIARILPYEERLGAKYYLGRYLTKELADIWVSPQLTPGFRQRWRANAAWLAAISA